MAISDILVDHHFPCVCDLNFCDFCAIIDEGFLALNSTASMLDLGSCGPSPLPFDCISPVPI